MMMIKIPLELQYTHSRTHILFKFRFFQSQTNIYSFALGPDVFLRHVGRVLN